MSGHENYQNRFSSCILIWYDKNKQNTSQISTFSLVLYANYLSGHRALQISTFFTGPACKTACITASRTLVPFHELFVYLNSKGGVFYIFYVTLNFAWYIYIKQGTVEMFKFKWFGLDGLLAIHLIELVFSQIWRRGSHLTERRSIHVYIDHHRIMNYLSI